MNESPRIAASVRVAVGMFALGLIAGCYERVVSERPFPGMASRSGVPTAPDYTESQREWEERAKSMNPSRFDPLGDFGRWVGGLFSSGPDKPDEPEKPARPATAVTSPSNAPPPSPTSPFNTNPNP